MKEPIVFRDDITIKIEGGGIGFTLGARDHKGVQCIVWDAELTETSHGRSMDITTSAAETGGARKRGRNTNERS